MASYATITELRAMLSQVPAGTVNDAALQDALDRATGAIDLELGFAFGGYLSVAAARHITAGGGQHLFLPYHESGSLTAIGMLGTDLSTVTAITDYEVEWNDHCCLYRPYGWRRGRYEATAKWGYGSRPAEIVQLCLEVARDLWFEKDGSMSSNTVGVEGAGAVPVQYAWTHRQYNVLRATRLRYGDVGFS